MGSFLVILIVTLLAAGIVFLAASPQFGKGATKEQKAVELDLSYAIPKIGETLVIGDSPLPRARWWNAYMAKD